MDDLFLQPDNAPGYRLHRIEMLNWGTFDSTSGAIHRVEPGGKTSLLIGQNGSGKSTLADALLTLLVRPQTRSYNVAAGSHGRKRERNEASYIKGAFAHGSSADDNRAQTRYLRQDGRHFTGVLAYFHNAVLDRGFTLAQVLWLDPAQRAKRLCCFAREEKFAQEVFDQLQADGLRKQLKQLGFEVTDNFLAYERSIRNECGMLAKAMDVFNQTVSVKDIQSLNEFIRRHMLEGKPWRETLDSILTHFDQLSVAYRLLVEARQQLEALQPVMESGSEYLDLQESLAQKQNRRDASAAYFRQRMIDLGTEKQESFVREQSQLDAAIAQLDTELRAARERIRQLKNDLDAASSERLRQLPGEIKQAKMQLAMVERDRRRFLEALKRSGWERPIETEEDFRTYRKELTLTLRESDQELTNLADQQIALRTEKAKQENEAEQLRLEIRDLEARPTKLPRSHEALRRRLCQDLGIDAKQLPFAAELIEVRPEERSWEASAELILRHFGLSLLVPDRYYREVSRYVNATRLTDDDGRGQRLVYLRIAPSEEELELDRNREPGHRSLFHKVAIKEKHPLQPWLTNELRKRADFLCCDTLAEFQQCRDRAVTRERQVKFGPSRHEKDDRPRVADPRYFILGWDNKEKLKLLREDLKITLTTIQNLESELQTTTQRITKLRDAVEGMKVALSFEDFGLIDPASKERLITELIEEKERLEKADDRVRALTAELQQAEAGERDSEKKRDRRIEKRQEVKKYIADAGAMIKSSEEFLAKARSEGQLERFESYYVGIRSELAGRDTDFFELQALASEYQAVQNAAIEQVRTRLRPIEKRISDAMSKFLRLFPNVATREGLESHVDYLNEFTALYERIKSDDLPQHEVRFRERLRDKVLDEISLFQTMLGNEADEIRHKIELLNKSLETIDYDSKAGTVMRLEPLPTRDREIADFRQQLRDCTEGLLENTDQALEDCYLRVEKLIQKLRAENTRWRDKVIDVREWYDFVARETVRNTGEERNFHSDSQGQSGGEKAKLAFTILVAAVVYQFDIDPNNARSARFHFVVVDEMFSKVDDDYATYALNLFKQFGLQLLIVAPFDAKAKVTEPFVDYYLHVVKQDNRSQVYTMTCEEFQERFNEV